MVHICVEWFKTSQKRQDNVSILKSAQDTACIVRLYSYGETQIAKWLGHIATQRLSACL